MGLNVAELPLGQGLSGAESLRKLQLDKWLNCHRCDGVNVLWGENVLDKPCVDLIGCLGVLGGYFYTHMFICKTHLSFLAICCYLITDYLEDINDCFRTMWTNGLSHSNLTTFTKKHKD